MLCGFSPKKVLREINYGFLLKCYAILNFHFEDQSKYFVLELQQCFMYAAITSRVSMTHGQNRSVIIDFDFFICFTLGDFIKNQSNIFNSFKATICRMAKEDFIEKWALQCTSFKARAVHSKLKGYGFDLPILSYQLDRNRHTVRGDLEFIAAIVLRLLSSYPVWCFLEQQYSKKTPFHLWDIQSSRIVFKRGFCITDY